MKIHVGSDWHLDHDDDMGAAFLAGLKPQPDIDLLILAGDEFSICRPEETKTLYLRLLDLYERVLIVPGNHNFWKTTPDKANEAMLDAAALGSGRITACTKPQYVIIKGQRFYGGTLWYRRPQPHQLQHFIDYDYIQGHNGGEWMFEQQRLFENGLYQDAQPFSTDPVRTLEDTVIVSHHLPHPCSTPAIYRGSPADHFFMCEMTQAIYSLKPKAWLHGHSHDPSDYVVGDTRIVAHPRAYPWERRNRPPYEPKLIEV